MTIKELEQIYGITKINYRGWYKFGFPKPKTINLTPGRKGGMGNIWNQKEIQAWIDKNKLYLPKPVGLSELKRFYPYNRVNDPANLIKVKYEGKEYTINDVPNYIIKECKFWHANKMLYQENIINRYLFKMQRKREWYARNADDFNKDRRKGGKDFHKRVEWKKAHAQKLKLRFHSDPVYKAKVQATQRAWNLKNRKNRSKQAAERNRYRLANDPQYYIRSLLHANFCQAFKKQRINKPWKSSKYGISYMDIGIKLEKDAKEMGLTLNQLRITHHIDHIIPQTWYDLLDPSEVTKCYDSRNLRFLPKSENMSRGCKIRPEDRQVIEKLPKSLYPKNWNSIIPIHDRMHKNIKYNVNNYR